MRRLFLFLVGLMSVSATALAIDTGDSVEEVTATLINGEIFKLSDHRGQVVMVNFWAAWCEPCRAEMPMLENYYQKHRKDGFYLLAINMDDFADQEIAIKVSKLYSFPIALRKDSNYKPLGRVWRMPSTFVIDKNGILRKNGSKGLPVITQEELDTQVTSLLQ